MLALCSSIEDFVMLPEFNFKLLNAEKLLLGVKARKFILLIFVIDVILSLLLVAVIKQGKLCMQFWCLPIINLNFPSFS